MTLQIQSCSVSKLNQDAKLVMCSSTRSAKSFKEFSRFTLAGKMTNKLSSSILIYGNLFRIRAFTLASNFQINYFIINYFLVLIIFCRPTRSCTPCECACFLELLYVLSNICEDPERRGVRRFEYAESALLMSCML